MKLFRYLAGAMVAAAVGLTALAAQAAEPIKIGEINSYSRLPAFLDPYKRAGNWHLRKSMRLAASRAARWSSSIAMIPASPVKR
jgi:hypothetical protein